MKLILTLLLGITFLLAQVDLNNASAKELTALVGVGVKKAQAVVAYRDTHCFQSVGEFTKVKGIGVKTLEKNRENLTVGACRK